MATGEVGSPSKRKREQSPTREFPTLRTRMSPSIIKDFMKTNPTEQQLADIKSMGFDGLLKIKTDTVPGKLAHWLVDNFDPFQCSLIDGKLVITDYDVHLATGIPMGPIQVVEAPKFDKSPCFTSSKERWLSQYDDGKQPIKSAILNQMVSQKGGGDDFKRNFVVFIVSSFLGGVGSATASCCILKCLDDVSLIPQMNWCQFTRKHMMDSVIQWRKGTFVKFSGPIMVFVYIYLDRIVFQSREVDRTFPTLATWTKEAISARVLREKKVAKAFGKGIVEGPFRKEGLKGTLDLQAPIISPPHSPPHSSQDIDDVKSCMSSLACAGKDLAAAYSKFTTAVSEAQRLLPGSETVRQMSALADSLCVGVRSSQEEKAMLEPHDDDDGMKTGEGYVGTTTFFAEHSSSFMSSDQELIEALDMLERSLGIHTDQRAQHPEHPSVIPHVQPELHSEEKEKVSPSPKRQKLSPSEMPPSTSAEHSSVNPVVCGIRCELSHTVEPDISDGSPNVSASPQPSPSRRSPRLASSGGTSTPTDVANAPPNISATIASGMDNNPKLAPVSSVPQATMPHVYIRRSPRLPLDTHHVAGPSTLLINRQSVRADQDVPSFKLLLSSQEDSSQDNIPLVDPEKRTVVAPKVFRSPFLQRIIPIMCHLTQEQKDLADFAFAENLNNNEVLFNSGLFQLSRADIKTLLEDRISDNLINVWSHVLNEKEKTRSVLSHLRLFASIGPKGFNCENKVKYTKSMLVFFPVTSPNMLLVCVNFMTSMIDVIHPSHNPPIPFSQAARNVINFVKRIMVPKSELFNSVARFKTQSFTPGRLGPPDNKLDNGLFLMRHMETYKGRRQWYNSGLNTSLKGGVKGALERLKVKYCHEILTSNLNLLKSQVMVGARRCRAEMGTLRDKFMLEYILDPNNPNNDVIIQTDWMEVTFQGLRSLFPSKSVDSTALDLAGIYGTWGVSDVAYFPTTVRLLGPDGDRQIGRPYVKLTYLPTNAKLLKKVFVPIFSTPPEHWYLCVVDLEKKKNTILDSAANRRKTKREANVKTVINNLVAALSQIDGYDILSEMSTFEYITLDTPQQSNGCDCGMFVLKWIWALNDEILWTNEEYFQDMDHFREDIILKLLLWDRNILRSRVAE